jgi:hypothetical protein
MARANGVFNVPVFFRAEWTKLVCISSLVERLDLLSMAMLLSLGQIARKTGKIRSLASGIYQQPSMAALPFYHVDFT